MAEPEPMLLGVPVQLAEELASEGLVPRPVDEPRQTWNIGGPVTQDIVNIVGVFASFVVIADSRTLHRVLRRLADWLRRGEKPDPASGLAEFHLSIRTPRGYAHLELNDETSAEELQAVVDAVLRRPPVDPAPPVRLTLDTDVLIDLIDPAAEGRFKDEMQELADLALDGVVDMTYAATTLREFERGGDPARAAARRLLLRAHPALSKEEPPAALVRLDVSRFGDASMVLASDEEAEFDAELRAILVPHLDDPEPGPKLERKFSDLDNLTAHVRSGRDIFVTGNTNDFRPARREKLAVLGITVLTPSEALGRLRQDRTSDAE